MTNVAVMGARGYAGRELLRLLLAHPNVDQVIPLSGSTAGERVGDHIPAMDHLDLTFGGPKDIEDADVVFLATPDHVAENTVDDLRDDQVVIDLSRAHRQEGLAPGDTWTYGWADVNTTEEGTTRIANPGCYPTSAMLAIAPLLDAGLVGDGPIIVDGKSGLSGAGATPRSDLQYAEANESVRAYKVERHDHGDEIRSAIHSMLKDDRPAVRFTPHLVPQTRGLLTTCYVPAKGSVDGVTLQETARNFYAESPFVHVVDEPDTAAVRGSNHAQLSIHYDKEANLFVTRCAIDNLQKGAAGTAIQNMNHAMGWETTAGLEAIAA